MACFSTDFEHTRYKNKIYCVFYGFSFTVVKINVAVFCVMTSCCNLVDGWEVLPPTLTEALCSSETWDLLTNVQFDTLTQNITKYILRVCLGFRSVAFWVLK
jgi:hypothetical protein